VDRCRPFFIGLLGQRYGWIPTKYAVSDDERFEWLQSYPTGRSITELEMVYGAVNAPTADNAFIYLREPSFVQQVPEQYAARFRSESADSERKIA